MRTIKSDISNTLSRRTALHVLFWIGVFAYNLLENWHYSDDKAALLELYAAKLPLQMAIAYFLTYYQLPRYLITRKYGRFFVSFLITVYLTCVLYVAYRSFYFEPTHPQYFRNNLPDTYQVYFDVVSFVMYATSFFMPALIMAGIKLVRIQYQEQQKRELLEKEKLRTELSFLKNQLNPHFLFNTLNNLYMLTLKSSPQAPEVVEKLSETLDYILYRCQDKFVPLQNEIQLIENYLALERIRHHSQVSMKFSAEGSVESKRIAPLIMLSFIENAFKHGINRHPGAASIEIVLVVTDDNLQLTVFNSQWPEGTVVTNQDGIGLKNVRRQLELLYPEKHKLSITEKPESYFVDLRLTLT